MKTIQIPFQGFYESIHSSILDNEYESLFIGDTGEIQEGFEIPCHNWTNELMFGYCKLYVESFSKETEVGLVFESLDSPKYYNYSNDRIFAR